MISPAKHSSGLHSLKLSLPIKPNKTQCLIASARTDVTLDRGAPRPSEAYAQAYAQAFQQQAQAFAQQQAFAAAQAAQADQQQRVRKISNISKF